MTKARPPQRQIDKTRRSNLFSHVENTNQLLQRRELFEWTLKIIGDIEPNHAYKCPISEQHDDLVQLLIDLELAEYDWEELEKQTHREVGNRIIELFVEANKIIELKNRVAGKNGRVHKDALELVSRDIGDRFTFNEIFQLFTDIGVPESMFVKETKWRAVFYILSYYTTSKETSDLAHFLKIIERVTHPLALEGDEEKAAETQNQYNKYLKYDNIHIKNNKAYIGPSEEERELGADNWIDSDGTYIEPNTYTIFPDKVAELWILWGQMVILVNAYQENKTLNRDELDGLYFELIDKIEKLIDDGKLGKLKEAYERPFTSLTTAEIEARAKASKGPLDLISTFLVEITALKPDPASILKKQGEYEELIERVTKATRNMDKYESEEETGKREEGVQKHEHIHRFENSIQEKNINLNHNPSEANGSSSAMKISLKDKEVSFDEAQPAILVGNRKCALPPAQNEAYLAKALFSHPVGEYVDWSILHNEMTGTKEIGSNNNKRSIQDTVYRLNKRVRDVVETDDELLRWKNKSVCRNY